MVNVVNEGTKYNGKLCQWIRSNTEGVFMKVRRNLSLRILPIINCVWSHNPLQQFLRRHGHMRCMLEVMTDAEERMVSERSQTDTNRSRLQYLTYNGLSSWYVDANSVTYFLSCFNATLLSSIEFGAADFTTDFGSNFGITIISVT